jgi:NADH-quinone oxidoreductase subunit M
MLPAGFVFWAPLIILLTIVNVVYGSLIAMRQRDMKYLIGYSSVSHMGLVSMGFAALNMDGFVGAGIQMVSHGIMTALFFSVVGMIYDRTHTRNMDELSGMARVFPWALVAFVIGGLVSMGMPGLSGFIAEFPIFLGVWSGGSLNLPNTIFGFNPADFYPVIAILAAGGIIVTAAYILRAVGKVFFGDYDEHHWHDMRPLLSIDKLTLAGFSVILVIIGLFPSVIAPIVESGVAPVVTRLQEAQAGNALDAVQTAASQLISWLSML